MFSVKFYVTGKLIFLLCAFHFSKAATFRCYKNNFDNYTEVSIDTPECLINSTDPCIDISKETVIFVFGYCGKPTGPAVKTFIPGLIRLGTHNVVLLNWMKDACGGITGPLIGYYLDAGSETKKVGAKLGQALIKLVNLGMKLESIHLIGHSIGANLAGYAGIETQKKNITLPWITALDPGRPGFDPPTIGEPVNSTCAAFVDVVHCDPGGYGINKTLGHVDIWPNYGHFVNGDRFQPGCTVLQGNPLDLFVPGSFCNHNRCVFYYNASLVYPDAFEAGKAENYYDWVADGSTEDTVFIGLTINKQKRGNYYLSTNAEYPWGKGKSGLRP